MSPAASALPMVMHRCVAPCVSPWGARSPYPGFPIPADAYPGRRLMAQPLDVLGTQGASLPRGTRLLWHWLLWAFAGRNQQMDVPSLYLSALAIKWK